MILEGFEIDHWSCIQHLAVHDLPPSGIVVLHGPNGTGKSSIVAALRACLMDYSAQATAKELKRYFPKIGDEKPRVSVTFRAQGTSWRITKHFGTKNSKLEKRSESGTWTTEAATATDAHDQTRLLVGGKDSDEGLHQLLWLTQAEYHLPTPKDFDADVQSQLRNVLGVLQTPLDDRFAQQVHDQWSRWFNVKGKRKKESNLEKNLAILAQKRSDLDSLNTEFQSYEQMLLRSGDLEILQRELHRQLDGATRTRDTLQEEYERSLKRIEAHRHAANAIMVAQKGVADALDLQQRRADAEEQLRVQTLSMESARESTEKALRLLDAAEHELRERNREAHLLKEKGRVLQARRDGVNARQQALGYHSQRQSAREKLEQAERLHATLESLKKLARTNPAPEPTRLKQLEENRADVAKLRNELDAAAITLSLTPDPNVDAAQLTIDGAAVPSATHHSIRRSAAITLPGWGRLAITRGSDTRDLDVIEADLAKKERDFADGLAPFGIAASDASALDRLRMLAADQKVREPEMKRVQQELDRLAPGGLDPLQQQVARFEKLVDASDVSPDELLTADPIALEQDAALFKRELDANDKQLAAIEREINALDQQINGTQEKTAARGAKVKAAALNLRQQHATAKELHISLQAVVESLRLDLERIPTTEQIAQQVAAANAALAEANAELAAAELSDSERTIKDRLASAKETVAALETQLKEADKEYHGIEGKLSGSEGLHSKRAAAAAQVAELTRQTDREMLESEGFDRLRVLFEESRDKQLGAVLGPIHDRVLRWMKLLRIGGYQSMRFNDHFLPESLIAPNAEFGFDEESTGTIEQMALMVRLALGATLSRTDDPVATVLDDPLTHSDAVRLNHMRAVLRSAAAGDAGSTPPAGPLQILVFTCHPEWFRLDDARVIDLSNMAK